jgi:hypothetical protein
MNLLALHNILLADATTPAEWAALAVAVGATAFVLFRPKGKGKGDPLARSPEINSLAQQRSVERQMQNLLVELSEMARQVTAGLDTRAAKLDSLIREADQKIAILTSLQQAATVNQSQPGVTAPPTPEPVQRPSPYEPDPRHLEVYTLADQGQTPGQIAGQLNRPNGEIELILALRPR